MGYAGSVSGSQYSLERPTVGPLVIPSTSGFFFNRRIVVNVRALPNFASANKSPKHIQTTTIGLVNKNGYAQKSKKEKSPCQLVSYRFNAYSSLNPFKIKLHDTVAICS